MKNSLLIDMDTDRDEVIKLSKSQDLAESIQDEESARQMVLNDLTTVCNALGTLIQLAHDKNYMSADKSSNMCINFLRDNFSNTVDSVGPQESTEETTED